MDEQRRKEAEYIRQLSSEDAARYLIERYPNYCPPAIAHRSWKRPDQYRLARKFIQGKAHASDRGYKNFLSFMSIQAFLLVVKDGLPELTPEDKRLLAYHLEPCLRKAAKTDRQRKLVKDFIADNLRSF